jgi:hypothetical protein
MKKSKFEYRIAIEYKRKEILSQQPCVYRSFDTCPESVCVIVYRTRDKINAIISDELIRLDFLAHRLKRAILVVMILLNYESIAQTSSSMFTASC